MTISSADRRAADYIGHVVKMPNGDWTGYLTDRCGGTLVLRAEMVERAGTQQLQLVAAFGQTPDQKRLRREVGG